MILHHKDTFNHLSHIGIVVCKNNAIALNNSKFLLCVKELERLYKCKHLQKWSNKSHVGDPKTKVKLVM